MDGYNFNFRVRYQLQLQYSLIKVKEEKYIRLIIMDELMANFGKRIVNNTFDQNRFTIGLAYDFNKYLGVEIDYVHWFQQRPSGEDFYSRHIARFTLYHNIDLSKKEKKKDLLN